VSAPRPGFRHPLSAIGGPPESREWTIESTTYEPDIHPSAQINAFVTVDSGTKRPTTIGARTFAMAHCHIGHDSLIGSDCELAPNVTVGGWVELGNGVRVGMGATIRNRAKVGDGARIGCGAVVVKDVPAGEVHVGNPARNIETDPRIDPAWDEWWSNRDRSR
jgi:acyl-[acyl carrier protein]--UDP-N-acetylglucosamine O-acyltransferase